MVYFDLVSILFGTSIPTSFNILVKMFLHFNNIYSEPRPGQPSVHVVTTTATFITISWSVPSGSVVTSYEVMWQRDTSGECPDEDEGGSTINTDRTTINYNISGLEEDSLYRITVTAVNSITSIVSDTVTVITEEAGERKLSS